METIEFKKSNKKTYFLMSAGISFTIISGLFIFFPYTFRSFLMNNILVIRIVGIIGFLFFGYAVITMIKKIFVDKSLGIIINEDGITDNSSYTGVGLIKWRDIKAIRKNEVASTKFLLIDLKNSEEYITKNKSKIKQKLLTMNYRSYGTPITISSNFIDCDFNVLEEVITNSLSKYRETI